MITFHLTKICPSTNQTPTSVLRTIYSKDKNGKINSNLRRTDNEFNKDAQLVNSKKIQE